MQRIVTDDLDALLDILPPHVSEALYQQPDRSELLEVILDLGRPPEARFPCGVLNHSERTGQALQVVGRWSDCGNE